MVEVVATDLRGKMRNFGPLAIVRAEWWKESPKFVLLRYEIFGKESDMGVRLDLDKKAILDDVGESKDLSSALRENASDIWSVVVREKVSHSR